MKKITTFCLLLTLILCIVFTGCGNSDVDAANEDGNTEEQVTTPPEESPDGEKEVQENETPVDQESTEGPAVMIPVITQVPSDWEEPCIWAWADDGTNAFDAWPGEPMEILEEGDWYYAYVRSSCRI